MNYEIIDADAIVVSSGARITLETRDCVYSNLPISDYETILSDDLYYTMAHGYLMQIMNTSVTKWNGIKPMLDICNCSPDETNLTKKQ